MNLEEHIEVELEKTKRQETHLNHLIKHVHIINSINDIVEFRSLWFFDTHCPEIDLEYFGNAITEEDARTDLARIMRTLNVIFKDLSVYSGKLTILPKAKYIGDAIIGGEEYTIELKVPWKPLNCKVVETIEDRKYYQVTCTRGDE